MNFPICYIMFCSLNCVFLFISALVVVNILPLSTTTCKKDDKKNIIYSHKHKTCHYICVIIRLPVEGKAKHL